AMTQGKADPMKLFTSGKLKISGNIMASQKLNFLSKMDPSKAIEVIAKKKGLAAAGGAAAKAAAGPAPSAAPKADPNAPKFFAALEKRLAENKGLASEVGANITFNVTDPAASFNILGGSSKATLTIADADLPALASGNIKSLYQHGKVRIDGDISVAHRLGFLKGVI